MRFQVAFEFALSFKLLAFSCPVFREKLPLPLEKNPLGDKNFKAVWPQLVSRGKRLYGLVMEIPLEDRAGHIIPKELVMETVK